METPRGLLQFDKAEIARLELTPTEKDPTASLVLSARLTPELAEKMRCRDAIFNAKDKPHASVTRLDLGDAKLRDVDLSLPSATGVEGAYDWYRPELIYGFRAEVDGMIVRMHMRVRFKGRYADLVDFLEAKGTSQFDFGIRSLQTEFDWTGKDAGGTTVEMNGAAGRKEEQGPLFACIHCDNGVPRNADGMHMLDGDLRDCPRPNPETSGEPAMPAIHQVGSGRGPKQRNRRNFDPTAVEETEVEVVQ
jgi:hypothetical protein